MTNDNYFEIPTTYIEESTFQISCQLVDYNLSNISSGNLDSLVMTIYAADVRTRPIIGKNDRVNILNANQGTITPDGLLTISMRSKDTVLTIPNQINKYVVLLEWKFNSNLDSGKVEVAYFIRPGYKVK